MSLRQYALIASLLFTVGCTQQGDPVPSPTITTAPATESGVPSDDSAPTIAQKSADLVVRPGAVGAAKAGMTIAEAAATGLFETEVKSGGDACSGAASLQWSKKFSDDLDVTVKDGRITSIGIRSSEVRTANGVGVGNTLGEVTDAYGSSISPAIEAGDNQMGVYVNTGDKWLGFLVDENYTDVSPSSTVTFMEVTSGYKPLLNRDRC